MADIVIGVSVVLLIMRLVDMWWVVLPSYTVDFTLPWWSLFVLIGTGVLWVALFWWTLDTHPLFPINDPGVAEIEHHGGHKKEERYETAG
jgi:hypothetical protein